MTSDFKLPKGRYFPTGEFLGMVTLDGEEGPGVKHLGKGLKLYPKVLYPVFEALQEGPDGEELVAICSKIEGFSAEKVLRYLQEQEAIAGMGDELGVEVLDDLMLNINLGPLDSVEGEGGRSYYSTKDGAIVELNPAVVGVGLLNSSKISAMEAAFMVALEAKLDATVILALVLEDLPLLIASGGGFLEVIR